MWGGGGGGGALDSLGSGILVGKIFYGVLQKIDLEYSKGVTKSDSYRQLEVGYFQTVFQFVFFCFFYFTLAHVNSHLSRKKNKTK